MGSDKQDVCLMFLGYSRCVLVYCSFFERQQASGSLAIV
jgi:hypothetical protein